MYKLLRKEDLAPTVRLFEVEAPAIAQKAHPGQFIILMVDEKGERTPFTIADWDQEPGQCFHCSESGRPDHGQAQPAEGG